MGIGMLDLLRKQFTWSTEVFGPGNRTRGVVDHIRKECTELEECDGRDIMEWVDILILGTDGAMRAGFTPEEILRAWHVKNRINKERQWPDWRTQPIDKAIEHIR